MRRVKFPTTVDTNLKPAAVLTDALNPPPDEQGRPTGITYAQMTVRLPIAHKLRKACLPVGKAKRHVLLEETEWQELAACVQQTRWLIVSDDILAICQAVLDADQVDVREEKTK